ncbi:MAG TPA: prolipoprotein diacylglyceryl transferase [Candidatus Woesebacteria bacterium]|nr:prolipoprotein diacylglyceryl transferase [Candidatus Woesebacteria bacterium]
MHLYGLIIGVSIIIGINYFSRNQKVISKTKENFFIYSLLFFSIIGARLYHVIDYWNYYSQNTNQIYATWNGGLGIYGALIGGIIYIFFFSLFSRISFLKILDSITPILPLCQAIGRIGNFFNHEIPVWWLEASLNLILFFIIKSEALKNYSSTALYLIGYGSIRFFIEFFRNDTWTINGVKIAQLISIISLVIGIILINYEKIKIVQKDH